MHPNLMQFFDTVDKVVQPAGSESQLASGVRKVYNVVNKLL